MRGGEGSPSWPYVEKPCLTSAIITSPCPLMTKLNPANVDSACFIEHGCDKHVLLKIMCFNLSIVNAILSNNNGALYR